MKRAPYKLLTLLSVITIFMALGALILVSFWTFYPYHVIKFNTPYYQTNSNVYTQGGTGYYTINYCKYSSPPTMKAKYFVDTITYQVTNTPSVLPTGCHITDIQLDIPTNLPPDTYRVRVTTTYQVNPIRTITVTHETNKFKVIAL